jgi:hypothetical protein
MNISEQDYELISAYLDGMLADSQRAELEARLEVDTELRDELNALYQMVQLVKSLPELAAPRSYTLTPEQALRIRNERVSRPAESKIIRFVLPVLSAVASMALVLFGLSLLLTSSDTGLSPSNVAQLSSATVAVDPSASRFGETTPTVASTLAAAESQIAEIAGATEELPGETSLISPETDQAADEAPPSAGTIPMATSMPYIATAKEEVQEADGLFGDLFVVPSDTSAVPGDASTGGAAADDPDEEGASTTSEMMEAAPLMEATEELEAPELTQRQAEASATPTLTATETMTNTPTTTSTPLPPTSTQTPLATATSTASVRDVTDASPPSQLIGLVLVALGLSLGVITLVIARRAASL